MERKNFLKASTLMVAALVLNHRSAASLPINPMTFNFKDDGSIPNSKYPLVIYQNAFAPRGTKGASWLEERFASNGWGNSWRWGVYDFHHYHSNTHEVLGVFSGNALLHMGGEKGEKLKVAAGDIIVIPAGVGHKNLEHSRDFTVVGAYPHKLSPDLMHGNKEERPTADKNIGRVKMPDTDPFEGKSSGIIQLWQ